MSENFRVITGIKKAKILLMIVDQHNKMNVELLYLYKFDNSLLLFAMVAEVWAMLSKRIYLKHFVWLNNRYL